MKKLFVLLALFLFLLLMWQLRNGVLITVFSQPDPFKPYAVTTRLLVSVARSEDAEKILAVARTSPEHALYSTVFFSVAAPEDVAAILKKELPLPKKRRERAWISSRPMLLRSGHLPVFGLQSPDFSYNESHTSALHVAAIATPHPEVIDMLVAAGQDVNEFSAEGGYSLDSILRRAYLGERLDVFKAVLRHKPLADDVWGTLTEAMRYRTFSVSYITAIVEAGYDLNYTPHDWEAESLPLNIAISQDNIPLARALLAAGASPDADKRGITPLLYAIRQNNFSMALMLLEAGADPRRTYEETSILEYTARAARWALEFQEYEKLDMAEQCLAVLSKAYPQDGPEKKRSRERVQEDIDTATQKLHETEKKIRADRYTDEEQRRDDLNLREFFSKKISRLNHLFNIF